MKSKVFFTVVSFLFIQNGFAILPSTQLESTPNKRSEILNTDSFMQAVLQDTIVPVKITKPRPARRNPNHKAAGNKAIITTPKADPIIDIVKSLHIDTTAILAKRVVTKSDSLLYLANPFLIELVYKGIPYDFNWDVTPDYATLYYGRKASTLNDGGLKSIKTQTTEQIIADLRQFARDEITRKAIYLYDTTIDDLPDPEINKNHFIDDQHVPRVKFTNDKDDVSRYRRKLIVRREKMGPWTHKANALAQFSESVVSGNWYQGGNSNIAILGILSGQLNYDNKKNIQWENNAEWHIGFNSVAGDTLRALSTNDDVVKINSKLGVKAGGNFFYSSSVDFSTQLFHSYNGINSTEMKTSFLTPVRLNVGVGLDYKYKKIFSLMLSPVAFKYIYVSDNVHVNPNLFGIKAGENHLSEVGSSFKSTLSYTFNPDIQLDSKLSFYTNYQKVEIDWEMVCNMAINRFLSTRISFNPRFDNTVIGSKANVQFKQLISVGFSHKFN